MNQLDFIGGGQVAAPLKDIRATRPSVAEQKAELCLRLNHLCKTWPPKVRDGSINKAREWVGAQQAALKIIKSSRASVQELTSAIGNMERFI